MHINSYAYHYSRQRVREELRAIFSKALNLMVTSSAVTLTSSLIGNLAEKPAVQFLVALFLKYLKTP